MKNDLINNDSNQNNQQEKTSTMNRRKFVEMTATAAAAFTIVPRHVLGRGFIAPSDKITLAYIGTGTEGLREMLPMLTVPEIQIVAVCDPNKEARGYRDWGIDYLKSEIRKTLNDPSWQPGGDNIIPGGRDNGQQIVEKYYSNQKDTNYKGCAAYEDVRELLDKGKDIDA
ncbi:MAG TPA: gfo/Idh/MocA family oxidoreductase, partial [Parafilimonas sp.]